MENKELYKIAIETRNMEIGLFWQRSNYFLVLNTAIAVGFFSVDKFPYQIALSLFGAFISTLWFRVNLGSKYWQSRWENRVSVLEKKLGTDINMFSASKEITDNDVKESLLNHKNVNHLSIYDSWVMSKPSVSKIMSILSASFIFLWVAMLIIIISTCK